MKSAFVTGATGFVGLNLVDELVRQGWEVTALHRVQSDLADLGRFPVTLMPGDITDPASLRAAIPESVDVVFHVAGNTNMWSRRNVAQTRENVEGTRNVVVAARARGAKKLVFTSSIAAYGQQTGELTETTKSNAEKSWINYQRTKWLAEEEVLSGIRGDFPATILNPGAIIGPYDTSGWARLFHLVAENRLPGVPPGELSAAHVREVAKAHVAAAEAGALPGADARDRAPAGAARGDHRQAAAAHAGIGGALDPKGLLPEPQGAEGARLQSHADQEHAAGLLRLAREDWEAEDELEPAVILSRRLRVTARALTPSRCARGGSACPSSRSGSRAPRRSPRCAARACRRTAAGRNRESRQAARGRFPSAA